MDSWVPLTSLSSLFHVGGYGSLIEPNACVISYIDDPAQSETLSLLRLHQFDLQDQDIFSDFLASALFVLPFLDSRSVLVKCQYGSSRSVALITAIVSILTGMDVHNVLSCIANKRSGVNANSGFVWQLVLLQSLLHTSLSDSTDSHRPILISPGANYRLFRACAERRVAGLPVEGFGINGVATCVSQGAFLYKSMPFPCTMTPEALAASLDSLNELHEKTMLTRIKKLLCTLHGNYAPCYFCIPVATNPNCGDATFSKNEYCLEDEANAVACHTSIPSERTLYKIDTFPCRKDEGHDIYKPLELNLDESKQISRHSKELLFAPCAAKVSDIGFFCARCQTLLFTDDNIVGHPGLLLLAYERGLFNTSNQILPLEEHQVVRETNQTDTNLIFNVTCNRDGPCAMDNVIGRPEQRCDTWHIEPLNWMFQTHFRNDDITNGPESSARFRGKDIGNLQLRNRRAIWVDRSPLSKNSNCTVMFDTTTEGKLVCPNPSCNNKLGNWSWTYTPCTCCPGQKLIASSHRDRPFCLHAGASTVNNQNTREISVQNYSGSPGDDPYNPLPLSPGFCVYKNAVVPQALCAQKRQ